MCRVADSHPRRAGAKSMRYILQLRQEIAMSAAVSSLDTKDRDSVP